MTWVKVCGLSTEADVAAAVAAGADAVGFVNVPASPRYLSLDRVGRLAADVPIHTILLTVDMPADEVLAAVEITGVSGVQPYGAHQSEAAAAAEEAGHFVLLPTTVDHRRDGGATPGIPLLDTPSTTQLGGTGRSFDWSLTEGIAEDFVLAGGLNPANVASAIAQVHPWGVDASSGLEESPGRKDHSMVADFITKAKMT